MKEIFVKLEKSGKGLKCLLAVIVGIIVISAVCAIIFFPKNETAYNVKTSLSEMLETSDMLTAEYTYNSIVGVKKDSDGGDTVDNMKYYVSYKGTVKSGFDFQKIDVKEDGEKIIVTLPEISIREIIVDRDLEFIFTNDNYDTEETWKEAYKACEDDLKRKSSENETLQETAISSAKETLTALVKPIESQLDDGKSIEIVYLEETK